MNAESEAKGTHAIEQSLIAAILAYPQALDELQGDLKPHQFADRGLGAAFDAMLRLANQGVPISPTAVAFELRRTGQLETDDDEQFLHDLWGSSGSAANAQWCADQIRSAWQLREAAHACSCAARELLLPGADLGKVVDLLQGRLQAVENCSLPTGPRDMCEDLSSVFVRTKAAAQSGGHPVGPPTGYPKLDRCISGLQPSSLIVLAALTGIGKTALAVNIAANVARTNAGAVVVFSMEMGRPELAARLSASETELDLRLLTGGQLSDQELGRLDMAQEGLQAIGRNILLDVSGRVTPATIRTHLRRIARRQKISLVVVDYLQLCGTSERAESQYVRTSMISADLKALAVDFNVPVLALSQLSREAAKRAGEPRLSDLRDSGTIEQDANVVMFIHRRPGTAPNAAAEASIIVAKNRNGPIGKCTMHWNPKSVRFTEPSDGQTPQAGD